MKKVLIVLLALAIAGGLFADEVIVSGEVNTGIFFRAGDSYDDPTAELWNDDDAAYIAKIGVSYDADVWGAQIGIKAIDGEEDGVQYDNYFGFYDAHGWLKFMDGLIILRGGLIDPNVWNTGGWVDTGFANGGGVRVEVEPFDGLSLGAKFGFGTQFGPDTISDFFQETAFGFAFDGGIFGLSASGKVYSEVSDREETDFDFTAGFGFYGLDIVDIYLGFLAESLIAEGDSTIMVGLNVDIDLGALGAGIEVGLTMVDGLSEVWIDPFVSFSLSDRITVGGDVGFTFADNDGIGLSTIEPGVYLEYTLGGATLTPGLGLIITTDHVAESATDFYAKLLFGWVF